MDFWVTYLAYVIWGVCVLVLAYVSVYIVWIRKLKRTWKISALVIQIATLALLVSSLVIVPLVFGNRFFSSSFQLQTYSAPNPIDARMVIQWLDGTIFNISHVGVRVWWSHSYFVPVQVHYNGFDYLMLIYNITVDDPADVVKNKDYLVWGAWEASYELKQVYGGGGRFTASFENKRAYDFYIDYKDFTNYTMTVHVGTTGKLFVFGNADHYPVWVGQDLRGTPISPGTYYVYFMTFGKVAELGPLELEVLELYWRD